MILGFMVEVCGLDVCIGAFEGSGRVNICSVIGNSGYIYCSDNPAHKQYVRRPQAIFSKSRLGPKFSSRILENPKPQHLEP